MNEGTRTMAYLELRACERFGLDPRAFGARSYAERAGLVGYELVRMAEETVAPPVTLGE